MRLALDGEKWARLGAYVDLLFRWNERLNLTALDVGDGGLERLIIEPLMAAVHVPPGSRFMMDIGSGGGSPAIPMKIGRPELGLRMVESRARKAAFLRQAVRHLDLSRVAVENCRYETLGGREELRGEHEVLTVRGVRFDGEVAARLQEFVRSGGALLVFRSRNQAGSEGEVAPPLCVEARVKLLEGSGSELLVVRKAGLMEKHGRPLPRSRWGNEDRERDVPRGT